MKKNYSWLLRVRPAIFGSLIKKILFIRRGFINSPYGKFYIDPVSNFGNSLISDNTYEKDLIYSIQDILKEGDTFLDLGANEGFFSILASKIVGVSGKVIAIEPQTRCQSVLIKNIGENKAFNIGIYQRVISDTNGIATLTLAPDMNTGSSGMVRMTKYKTATEDVLQLTLSNFIDQLNVPKIKLIKIDIEGFEYEAVLGSRELFSSGLIENIALELHPYILEKFNKSESEIVDFLLSVGYKVNTKYSNFILTKVV